MRTQRQRPDDAAAAKQTSPDPEAGVKSRRTRDEFARRAGGDAIASPTVRP